MMRATMMWGDAIATMRKMVSAPNSMPRFDLVLTDPPYNVKRGGAWMRGSTAVDAATASWNEGPALGDWLPLAFELVKPGGFLAMWHDRAAYANGSGGASMAWDAVELTGFELFAPFFLVKKGPTVTPRPTFGSAIEQAIVARKPGGAKRWYGGGTTPNVAFVDRFWKKAGSHPHPAEKPLSALVPLVRALSPEGGSVLDPFAGVASTLVAARSCGRPSVGIELNEAWRPVAEERLAQKLLFAEVTRP